MVRYLYSLVLYLKDNQSINQSIMSILTPSQLQKLKEHKYSSEGKSILEYIMQPFWNWVVTYMPLWVAPNLITISGLVVNIITASLIILCSPQANSNEVRVSLFM